MGTTQFKFSNETSICKGLMRILVCFIFGWPTIVGLFISKKNKYGYLFVVIFREIIPPTLANFYMFSVTKVIYL
jgi:hypothetical protein